jgi:SAM-dependent methyltransferase
VVETWRPSTRSTLLRAYSDHVNRNLIAAWLPAHVGRVLKTDVFDEAVADGLYPFLRERADEVVGIDVSEGAVAAARRRHPDFHAECADVRDLDFADGSFDVVVSNSTLDHLETIDDIRAALRELERVLAPGGVLVVSLDNPVNPLVAVRNALPFGALNRLGLVPYNVGATCGPGRLRRLLDEAGFVVGELTAIMHVPRVLAGLSRRTSPLPRSLIAAERLARAPTRYLTGQFVAARALKP